MHTAYNLCRACEQQPGNNQLIWTANELISTATRTVGKKKGFQGLPRTCHIYSINCAPQPMGLLSSLCPALLELSG